MEKIIQDAINKASDAMTREVNDSVHASLPKNDEYELEHNLATKLWSKVHAYIIPVTNNEPISNSDNTFKVFINKKTNHKYVASYTKKGLLIDFKRA